MGQQANSTSWTVLLVESSAIIGLDLTEELERRGYVVAGPYACAAALDWMAERTPGLAVLDVDLRSGGCVTLARELRTRGVPILVFSAHDQRQSLPEFQDLPWLSMPAPMDALGSALRALAAARKRATALAGRKLPGVPVARGRETGRGPRRRGRAAETPPGGKSA